MPEGVKEPLPTVVEPIKTPTPEQILTIQADLLTNQKTYQNLEGMSDGGVQFDRGVSEGKIQAYESFLRILGQESLIPKSK